MDVLIIVTTMVVIVAVTLFNHSDLQKRMVASLHQKPRIPTLVNGRYEWPDGSLFYTQGDCRTCSNGHANRTDAGKCVVCGRVLGR